MVSVCLRLFFVDKYLIFDVLDRLLCLLGGYLLLHLEQTDFGACLCLDLSFDPLALRNFTIVCVRTLSI